jgi:hypothetical protein
VYEAYLHQLKFRTELCKKGALCDRRMCFFAHKPDELRALRPRGDLICTPTPALHIFYLSTLQQLSLFIIHLFV